MAAQDPARTLRFDLAPFANCTTLAGQSTSRSSASRTRRRSARSLAAVIQNLAADLAAGVRRPSKRYLVYYDGPTNDTDVAGPRSATRPGPAAAQLVATVWMRSCGADLGAGDVKAAVAAHELLHSLGALPRGAAHPCRGDDGHPCDSRLDLMYPLLSDHFENLELDVGRDDYYGHAGNWLDIQDSR